jgi:hypothetical protein
MNLKEMVKNLTLEVAMDLYENYKICCVCTDGDLKYFEKRNIDQNLYGL